MTTHPLWLHRDARLQAAGWRHGWTDDTGPDFKSAPHSEAHARAMAELCQAAGLTEVAWCAQEHGGTLLKASTEGLAGPADALWTDRPGLGVVGRSADCPLVLLAGFTARGKKLAGFAHASWRSTVRGITRKLADALLAAGVQPGTTEAVICPSAGPCCYEVGAEVKAEAELRLGSEAAAFFTSNGAGKHIMDLWAASCAQLVAAGLPARNIRHTGWCTICGGPERDLRFASYRRQGEQAGRFAAVIGC